MRLLPILLFAVVACGDDDGAPPDARDGGAAFDGDVFGDAAPVDAGGAPDGDVGEPGPLRPGATPDLAPNDFGRSEDPDDAENAASCYDGLDNDAADDSASGFDCDDPSCSGLPSCCVARPQADECCQNTLSANVLDNLASCIAGGSPTGCLTSVTEFGAPTPFVDDGLALGGDGIYDSGLLLDTPIDLRTSNLDVRFDIRQAACSGACRESAAIGVTTQEALGANSHVDPDIAFVVSGERRQARLLINDDVVRVWDDVGSGAWQFVLRPDGSVLLGRDGGAVEQVGNYTPTESTRVVAWGHSRNPGATDDDGIRIESLNINVDVCDMPRAWSDRTPLSVAVVDEVSTSGATSPSVIVDDVNSARMVYAQGGDIHLATQEGARPERWARTADPLLVGDEDTGLAYSQPALVFADGVYHLYYVEDTAETRTWMHASGDSLDNLETNTPLIEPTEGFADASIVAIAPPERPERFALVARTDAGLQAFASVEGETWTLQSDIPIALLDATVVAEPSLVVVNNGYQLAVALRRGARWSIAMFASAELVHWRLVEERALSAGDQTERVGVRDMDLFVRDSMIQAVYVGLDGVRDSLHHAQRPIPTQELFAASAD